MAPHLMRAQGAYKADKHATPTPRKNTSIEVMGLMETEERKPENQQAEEKRWVFSFDLKEESDVACLTEKEREFQMTGPIC